jgi:hypothetical protein
MAPMVGRSYTGSIPARDSTQDSPCIPPDPEADPDRGSGRILGATHSFVNPLLGPWVSGAMFPGDPWGVGLTDRLLLRRARAVHQLFPPTHLGRTAGSPTERTKPTAPRRPIIPGPRKQRAALGCSPGHAGWPGLSLLNRL